MAVVGGCANARFAIDELIAIVTTRRVVLSRGVAHDDKREGVEMALSVSCQTRFAPILLCGDA